MNDSLRAERTEKLVEFGLLINYIGSINDKPIPPRLVYKLAGYKRLFTAVQSDIVLGDVFASTLPVIEYIAQYIRAYNAGNKVAAAGYYRQAELLWSNVDKAAEKVVKRIV